MESDEYEDYIDEAEDDLEQGQDLQDYQMDQYETATYPQAKKEQSIYNWFWRVVRLNKPMRQVKVGNLNKPELGDTFISVRDSLNLYHLGHIFHHKTFGNYFGTQARIIAGSSMAKNGWFMDLSISQRKIRERQRTPKDERQRWRMFKKKNPSVED